MTVSRKNNTSYAFSATIHLVGPPTEVITFSATWTAKGQAAGSYNISVLVLSDDPDVDPEFKECQDTCEVQIVIGAPIMGEPIISPVHHSSGLNHHKLYVYPWQDIEVRCNVTCFGGIKNVTVCYSVDSGDVWNQSIMSRKTENEWIGTVPGQSEGKLIVFYVEAFSSTGKSSRTREYRCTVLDLQVLELRTILIKTVTLTIILVGCLLIFAIKRRRMTELL